MPAFEVWYTYTDSTSKVVHAVDEFAARDYIESKGYHHVAIDEVVALDSDLDSC